MTIPFNKPYMHGTELALIKQAVSNGKISGDGIYSNQCQKFFETKYGFLKTLLTTSCTDALEMCALLLNIEPGDEVILPSYTFVSTANAFVLRGARLRFVDSLASNPNLDHDQLEELITPATKAIVVVHYAGIACDMDQINEIARRHNIHVVEDAAQCINAFYKNRPLASLGSLGTFSFHETKNIISGEGGLLAINSKEFIGRAEIIREKGTNRSAFFRGEIDKYNWVDIGSSFLPSELTAAFLYGQLQIIETIQSRRNTIWEKYHAELKGLQESHGIKLPFLPNWASNNAHIYYLVMKNGDERNRFIQFMKEKNIMAVFHYQSLHQSPYYSKMHDGRELKNSDHYSDCLVRLPLFYELSDSDLNTIIEVVLDFFKI